MSNHLLQYITDVRLTFVQVVQVLSSLRNGITSEGSRVPLVISLFICEALQVMLAPDHVLYVSFVPCICNPALIAAH
jgi:hypothetical protein